MPWRGSTAGPPSTSTRPPSLLAARGEDLARLTAAAARVRDAGLAAAGRPGVVTYSPKVFIPLTRLCRDRCHYCTFVTVPAKLRGALPLARRGPRDRPRGRGARLQGGAVHPGRPPRGPLAAGPGVARRAGLRLHARLRAGDGGPGAGGDRAAAAPQPRGDVVAGAEPAEAGRPVDGDDARDHLHAAVHREGRGPLRLARQGPGGAAAGARGRGPSQRPVHHRHPGRHRRDARRAGRLDLRDPAHRPAVRQRAGGDRAELPRQAGHRDAPRRTTSDSRSTSPRSP